MMQRFPEGTEIEIDDFPVHDVDGILDSLERQDYSSMWHALSSEARKAIDAKDYKKGKALWLLADTLSMSLKPTSLNEPFKPFMIMEGKRSALPEDFNETEIELLSQVAKKTKNSFLGARLADLCWLLMRPRKPEFALVAIDNYQKIPITDSKRDTIECWNRAIQLCYMLKKGAGKRLDNIQEEIITILLNSNYQNGMLPLAIFNLLDKQNLLNTAVNDATSKIEEIAQQFLKKDQLLQARAYFDLAADVYFKLDNKAKQAEMLTYAGETWEAEAAASLLPENPNNIVASSFYENAIQKYRSIPKSQRSIHNIDSRISSLYKSLAKAGQEATNEMQLIETPIPNFSEIVHYSINQATGRENRTEALFALANIYKGERVTELRDLSEEMINKYPLQSLFASTHFSRDGRVIAKEDGCNLGDQVDNEKTIWPHMVKHYTRNLDLIVQGSILPALGVLQQEHRITEVDFLNIVRQSPAVPSDRLELVAKALATGYEYDFSTSLHILVPQIENLVRYHLKLAGAKTTNLDRNGIENENGLSTLVNLPEMESVFGKDLSFEIKALFCDSLGPNLRNELAHGLINTAQCVSIYSVYAWWLLLRIVVNTFWNNKEQTETTSV